MSHHRIAHLTNPEERSGAVATAVRNEAFIVCPMALRPTTAVQAHAWQQLFERAFREAQAVVRPSVLERLQADTVN